MPTFSIQGADLELSRTLALIDTNLLLALVNERDEHHWEAVDFVEKAEFVMGVSPPVIVEACGLLIGRLKRRDLADSLLRTILDPGSGFRILPAPHGLAEGETSRYLLAGTDWMKRFDVDYVDAFLMQMADMITATCKFAPPLVIVTKDLRDFNACLRNGLSYTVYDFRTRDSYGSC